MAPSILNKEIAYLKGIGPLKAEILADDLGIKTVMDMLTSYPFRYIDKSTVVLIKDLNTENTAQVKGILVSKKIIKASRSNILTATLKDSSGFLEMIWFKGIKYIDKYLELNKEYLVYGKPGKYKGRLSIAHPEMEAADKQISQIKSYEAVYSGTERLNNLGFDSKSRRRVIRAILDKLKPTGLKDTLPEYLIKKLRLCSRNEAINWIHIPPDLKSLEAARRRIKFEEVFYFQLKMLYGKFQRNFKYKGHEFAIVDSYFNKFYKEKLPFELTNAQKRVVKEIRADLGSGLQMNRLLQGDVGSGKTMVGLLTMLIAKDNGYQSVLMAPTEILAQQHFNSITESLSGTGMRTAFLSGSVKGKTRKELLHHLKEGNIDILIGTHAVLEDPVVFKNLGLSIIDEQHRFGVMQRSKLWTKSRDDRPPHVLVMTATPIPRTLAMTVYGDLEVSVIDELPPGRKKVHTIHKSERHRPQVIEFLHREIEKGRQIYIVYPLIEESAKLDLADLQQGYDRLLQHFPPPKFQISIVHGRMKPQDKDNEMQKFADGKTHIMVATTVIEVGVNVPNASVMVIENTERFGLSQLHQLRGRVGRGAEQSYCILMSSYKLSKEAKTRIQTMVETNDGFKIAEVDLKLRGPGDIEGTRQSGVKEFKLFNIIADQEILNTSRQIATILLEKDPHLQHPENEVLLRRLIYLNPGKKVWGRIS